MRDSATSTVMSSRTRGPDGPLPSPTAPATVRVKRSTSRCCACVGVILSLLRKSRAGGWWRSRRTRAPRCPGPAVEPSGSRVEALARRGRPAARALACRPTLTRAALTRPALTGTPPATAATLGRRRAPGTLHGRRRDDDRDARRRLGAGDTAQLLLAGPHLGDPGSDARRVHQPVHVPTLVGGHQGDDAAGLAGARRATAAVQVVLRVGGRVHVDDQVEVVD